MAPAEKRARPTQVNIQTKSAAEYQRWKAEAKRQGWTVTHLIRVLVNRFVDEQEDWRESNGLKGLR